MTNCFFCVKLLLLCHMPCPYLWYDFLMCKVPQCQRLLCTYFDCLYIYVRVLIYMYIYIYICVDTYSHMYIYYTHVYIFIYTYICVCMCKYTSICVCMYEYVYTMSKRLAASLHSLYLVLSLFRTRTQTHR